MLLEALDAEEFGADRIVAISTRSLVRIPERSKEGMLHGPPCAGSASRSARESCWGARRFKRRIRAGSAATHSAARPRTATAPVPNHRSLASSRLDELLAAVDTIGALRAAHRRVVLSGAPTGADPRVHHCAAMGTETYGHDRASVIVVVATLLPHSLLSFFSRGVRIGIRPRRSMVQFRARASASRSPSRASAQNRARAAPERRSSRLRCDQRSKRASTRRRRFHDSDPLPIATTPSRRPWSATPRDFSVGTTTGSGVRAVESATAARVEEIPRCAGSAGTRRWEETGRVGRPNAEIGQRACPGAVGNRLASGLPGEPRPIPRTDRNRCRSLSAPLPAASRYAWGARFGAVGAGMRDPRRSARRRP